MSGVRIILAGVLTFAGGCVFGSSAQRLVDSERAEYAIEQMRDMTRNSERMGDAAESLIERRRGVDKATADLFAADDELKRANDNLMAENHRLMRECLR